MLFGNKESVIKQVEYIEKRAHLVGAIVMRVGENTTIEAMLEMDQILKRQVNDNDDIFIGPYAPLNSNGTERIVYPNAIGIWQHREQES